MTRIRRAALVGNPNSGKSALFNKLTGARQKIANYAGVTVERKVGRMTLPSGEPMEVVDLPGAYSFDAASPDEVVTSDVLHGRFEGEARPDLVILVLDAANLEQHLVFAQEVLGLGIPTIAALNMVDLAERDGLTLDAQALEKMLGVPVIPTVAVRRKGLDDLTGAIGGAMQVNGNAATPRDASNNLSLTERRLQARNMAREATLTRSTRHRFESGLDRVLLHPWIGPLFLLGLLFFMFQAVFAWATPFADAIEGAIGAIAGLATDVLPEGFFRDLVVEGVLAGVGSVVVFLPQIVILFAFILVMEASGYMARAAFLMDRMMASVGLSGRSFIPLLSSFACAIPGIMATRAIADEKDRLTTILIAPLMTCSARLPVYAVVIAAVIPNTAVGGAVGLQGLTLFALYIAGIFGAMAAALILRRTVTKGGATGFIMEMPRYQVPVLRDLVIGLWHRAWVFLRRAGTIIFAATIILWLLLTFPKAGPGESQVDASIAGQISNGIAVLVEPIGFNRDIALSLVPAMAAREIAVSSLGTIYAVEAEDEEVVAEAVTERIAAGWTLPTALAFLAWFVFAPQCLSTIAVARRETNGWKWPAFMVAYLFGAAYIFAGITYWIAVAAGL